MVIDWTFIVLVLILVVVLAIAWFIISMDDVNILKRLETNN